MVREQERWYEKKEFSLAARCADWTLDRCGPFARLPPNLVTLFGALLIVPMLAAWWRGNAALGGACFALSLLTDAVDGALARHQFRRWKEKVDSGKGRSVWLRLGPTEFGTKFDPIVDKLRYFPAIIVLGHGLLPAWSIACAAAFALLLTFLREAVRLTWGLKSSANAVGKIKVYTEAGAIACLIVRAAWSPAAWAALALFVAATLLAAGSLIAHGSSVRRQVRALEKELGLPSFLEKAGLIRAHLENRKP